MNGRVLCPGCSEFAPVDDDADALGEQMSDLGMAVEDVDARRRAGRRRRRGAGARAATPSRRRHDPAGRRRHRRRRGAADRAAARSTWQVGDLVPLATLGTVMPNGMEIGRRKLRGEWSNGMLCSPRELGLGDDHAGILILPPDLPPRHAARRGAGRRRRRRLRPRPHPQPARRLSDRRRGPRPRRPPRRAVRRSRPRRSTIAGRRRGSSPSTIVDADLCGRFTARVLTGVRGRPSPPWMADRLTRAGMRPINNVVDVSNYVMLELGQPNHTYDLAKLAGRWLPGPPGPRRRDDRDARRRRARPDRRRRPDLRRRRRRRSASPGSWAGPRPRSTTPRPRSRSRWRGSTRRRSRRPPARLGLRSEASARFERGADPEIVDLAVAPLRRAAAATCPDAQLAPGDDRRARRAARRRPPCRCGPTRVNALLGTDADAIDDIARLLRADRVRGRVRAGGRHRARHDPVVAARLRRRDRRHRGGRPPPTATRASRKTVPSRPHPGGLSAVQQDRRLLRQVLVGLGWPRRCRSRSSPRATWPGGPRADGHHAHQPAGRRGVGAAHVAAPGPAEGGRLQRVAPQRRRVACSRSATCSGCRLAGRAAARRARGARRRAGRAGRRRPRRRLGRARGRARRGTPSPVARGGAARPAPDPHVLLGEGGAARRGRRGRPGGLEALRHRRAGGVAGARPRPPASPCRQSERRYRPVSRFPSSDIDLAFVVAEVIPAGDVERTLRDAAGALLVDLRLFDVYRGAVGRRGRAQPGVRLACRPWTARSPMPTSARCARSASRRSRLPTAPAPRLSPSLCDCACDSSRADHDCPFETC